MESSVTWSSTMLQLLVVTLLVTGGESESLPDLPRLLASRLAQEDDSCAADSRAFLQGLKNFSVDALSMYDASEKSPVGVLWGNTLQLGHYDECLGVAHAQYCLAQVSYHPTKEFSEDSAWAKLLTSGDESKIPRDHLEWALCVPKSCSPFQLNLAFMDVAPSLVNTSGIVVEAYFDRQLCTSNDDPVLVMGPGSLVYLSFLAFLVFLVIIGSVVDSRLCRDADDDDPDKEFRRKGLVYRVMVSFSARKNVSSLGHMRASEPFLDVIHFHKALFMMLIVGGHRLLVVTGHPLYNGCSLEKFPSSPQAMLVANGPALVDVFFTLGGFLLCYLFVSDLEKNPSAIRVLLGVVNRYLRLTPLYAVVIGFYIFVLPYMGRGPYWKTVVVHEQHNCQEQWWTNILYVNNYVGVTKMCLLQSWYLSADFHLCVLGLVLVYVVHRWPRVGWPLLGVVSAISVLVPIVIVYVNEFLPILKPFWINMQDLRVNSRMFREAYIPTHTRATPYLMGIIGAFLIRNKKWTTRDLPQFMGYGVYFLAWIVAFITMMTSYVFLEPTRPFVAYESAIYFVAQKIAFASITMGCLIAVTVSQLEALHRLMWSRTFVVLSRLTYSAFIIHMAAQVYDMGSTKTPFTFDAYHMIWSATADYVSSYTLAFIGYILVEAPFRNLVKILIG